MEKGPDQPKTVDEPQKVLTMFWEAFKIMILWLIFPVVFFLFAILWRANSLVQFVDENTREVTTLELDDKQVVLFVSYPTQLPLEAPDAAGKSISLWMQYATPTVYVNPPTPGVAATPSPTVTPESYIISILQTQNQLAITDEKGRSLPMQMVLTPSSADVTPKVFFVQANQIGNNSQAKLILSGENGAKNLPITIGLETDSHARWRNFLIFLTSETAFIGTLAIALAGFAFQQWQRISQQRQDNLEKELEKQRVEDKEREIIENELVVFQKVLNQNFADGARLYEGILGKVSQNVLWKSQSERIDTIWKVGAPIELQYFLQLWLARKDRNALEEIIKNLGGEQSKQITESLKWSLENLDEEWQQCVSEIIRSKFGNNISLLAKVDQREWQTLLQLWPSLTFWQHPVPDVRSSFAEKIKFFREFPYPLGAIKAENDVLLLTARYSNLQLYKDLEANKTIIVSSSQGTGKTSTVLWLSYQGIRKRVAFPVYYPTSTIPKIVDIVSVWAKSLMRYIAITPTSFQHLDVAGRAAIAHLMSQYVAPGPKLSLLLHEAGLPLTGSGVKLIGEITAFTKNIGFKPQDESEILTLLREAVPASFKRAWLLFDINLPRTPTKDEKEGLCSLILKLDQVGIAVKTFINEPRPSAWEGSISIHNLKWKYEHLRELLKIRLGRFGEPTLSAWCDPQAARLSPDDRLIAASGGTPAGLLEKCNDLFKTIGENENVLSSEDLDHILGPDKQ